MRQGDFEVCDGHVCKSFATEGEARQWARERQADNEAADTRRAKRQARQRVNKATLRAVGINPRKLAVADIAWATKQVRQAQRS